MRSMFVHEYGFMITSTTLERPWLVLSSEHRTTKLPDGQDFSRGRTSTGRRLQWNIELDPWQLTPSGRDEPLRLSRADPYAYDSRNAGTC